MKMTKMSMVAALLLGANLYAIDNVKVNGDAKLYYATDDSEKTVGTATGSGGLFDQHSSAAQAALRIGATADLTEGVSTGVTLTALSTLGLENTLVGNVWEAQTAGFASDYWFSEAWVAGTAGKTTGKIGRQTLDTPLVFSETWSIAPNTFESIVALNQDLPDTTIVAAYVGTSNSGAGALGAGGAGIGSVVSAPVVANGDSRYSQFGGLGNGAYAFGVVNNSMKELTVQAWYYDVIHTATALWVSADLSMEGILAGVQYANIDPAAAGAKTGDATAVMLGYEMKDVVTVKAAYSTTNSDAGAGQNVAGAQSKLYTEMWWNYGQITQADTDSWLISAAGTVADIDLFAAYVSADHGAKAGLANTTVSELAVSASKSFGPLDASLVYINQDKKLGAGIASAYQTGANTKAAENMLQVYLTYNF